MFAIVVSRADDASVHIGEQLRDIADWRECVDRRRSDDAGGGTVYRLGDRGGDLVELREIESLHLETEGIAAVFGRVESDDGGVTGADTRGDGPELVVFASRHAGETGPLLTAHHTGNIASAEFGGEPGDLARACPAALRRVLSALRDHAPADYDVGMECTHHGPSTVGAPSMFVEVGSDRPQWEDPEAARAVARAILALRGTAPDAPPEPPADTRRHLVGIGGGHYAPRFERVVRETDWAVGHVAANWALEELGDPGDHREIVAALFAQSRATCALVDGEWPRIEAEIEALGHRLVSETWVRETSGVPLALVDRLEAELCPVSAGLRFGARASAEGALAESTGTTRESPAEAPAPATLDDARISIVELPAAFVAEAQGIDRSATLTAVREWTLAFETVQNGTRVGDRAAFVADADADADVDALVEALAGILETAYDAVEVTSDAVVATETAFDPERARDLGVPDGPAFGRLADGEAVDVDGETIDPAAVHTERTHRFPREAE